MADSGSGCERLLAFDTTIITSNELSKWSVLELVDKSNYSEMQSSASAAIPGYFSGDYSDFELKRSSLRSLFAASGMTKVENGFYRHALSEAGALAYGECVARQSQSNVFAAWVVSKPGSSSVTIVIRNIVGGTSEVEVSFESAQPTKPVEPIGAGDRGVTFEHDPKSPFKVTINGKIAVIGKENAVTIELPPYRQFVSDPEHVWDVGTVRAHGGGNGSTTFSNGGQGFKLVAPAGWNYERHTLSEDGPQQVVSFGGVFNLQQNWQFSPSEENIQSIEAYNIHCEGNAKTGSEGWQRWKVRRVLPKLREVG